ncbi:MAG: hypothetical protein E6Q73_04360 [Pseudorhodobacter sp.]|nr:MAG: hypothetical protein E6Q73_04360 [Pseudorhodobacter sp.]
MSGWKSAYDRRDWDEVENWWRACDDTVALQALLEQLRRDVPRERLENGMEEDERHVLPEGAPEAWRGGATILFLGELEAKALGDPVEETEQWAELSEKTAIMMQGFLKAQEVTQGHRALSRSAHAEAALEFLETIERETAAMCEEMDPEGTNPDDRSWLKAVIAQAAVAAFTVGVHARAAVGKEIEQHALRGRKNLTSAQAGGKARSAAAKQQIKAVISEMCELIDKGHSKSAAAMIASNKGIGTSKEANRKTYQRHGPKKK